MLPSKMNMGVIISTSLGESIDIDNIYKGIKLCIGGLEIRVELMSLELYDFGLISGMN
jgi:hypothetical protein